MMSTDAIESASEEYSCRVARGGLLVREVGDASLTMDVHSSEFQVRSRALLARWKSPITRLCSRSCSTPLYR